MKTAVGFVSALWSLDVNESKGIEGRLRWRKILRRVSGPLLPFERGILDDETVDSDT